MLQRPLLLFEPDKMEWKTANMADFAVTDIFVITYKDGLDELLSFFLHYIYTVSYTITLALLVRL